MSIAPPTIDTQEEGSRGCCERRPPLHNVLMVTAGPIRVRKIAVRDVRTVIDEPQEREGTNMGPTPTETMVAALIACTNVISHKCAKKHGVELKAMTIDAESTLDRCSTQLLEEIEVPFPKIRLLVDVTTDASEADLEKVKADLHRFCPISKVVRNSGTELEEVWNVKRTAGLIL
jgi:putative redox protein